MKTHTIQELQAKKKCWMFAPDGNKEAICQSQSVQNSPYSSEIMIMIS